MVKVEEVAELLGHKDLDILAEYRIKPIKHFQEFPEKWEFETVDDEPIAMVHYENNDWYLCTIKNLLTLEEHRGQGIGTAVLDRLLTKLDNDDRCLLYAGDIDVWNKASSNRDDK